MTGWRRGAGGTCPCGGFRLGLSIGRGGWNVLDLEATQRIPQGAGHPTDERGLEFQDGFDLKFLVIIKNDMHAVSEFVGNWLDILQRARNPEIVTALFVTLITVKINAMH